MTAPRKVTRPSNSTQAHAARSKLLRAHRDLMKRDLQLRREFGPLILRWARELSGVSAFFVLGGDPTDVSFHQLDGLVGEGKWVADSGRWINGIDILVESTNPNIHLVRFIVPSKAIKLTNEQTQKARERRGGTAAYPSFPWESQDEATEHWLNYRRFQQTDPRTKTTGRM